MDTGIVIGLFFAIFIALNIVCAVWYAESLRSRNKLIQQHRQYFP